MERALTQGNYSDLHQFVVVAVRNQLELEASVALEQPVAAAVSSMPPAATTETPLASIPLELPAMLKAVPAATAAELPKPVPVDDDSDVLWGQINRVLPIAVGVRVLAHLSADRANGVSVEEWHETATAVAVALRPHLRKLDEAAGRRHGSLWSTAFPDDTPASAHRYVNQFLGLPKGRASPMAEPRSLASSTFDRGDTVATSHDQPARSGRAFANPLFDDGDSPTRTFSLEETAFFINHLEHVSARRAASC